MQRNKYLDDLGIKQKDYGTNFCNPFDKRQPYWKQEQKLYGFDSRETWNLDHTFIEWLYSHCMMFKERAGIIVELTHPVFEYDGKSFTLLEAVDYIIECTKMYLIEDAFDEKTSSTYKKVQYAVHLWAEILPAMWW